MGLIDILTYMIVVKGNPVSEYYAGITIPRWESFGCKVNVFDAITPDSKPDFELVFDKVATHKYKVMFQTEKTFTPTEKAVWYSHVSLWRKCIELNQNIMVLEHDSYLIDPTIMKDLYIHDFVTYDAGAMGCYIISPELSQALCKMLIDEKFPIDCGPYGFVYDVLINPANFKFTSINKKSYNYKVASNQIYNPEFKTTINHYVGSNVEDKKSFLSDLFHEYILAETGKPIDVTKTIKVLSD